MSIEITATGVNVTHDETAGLQNATATPAPTGDANDNDIATSELPTGFSTRLATLGAGTPIGAALSGYDGSNNGLNVINIAGGGTIVNLALADADGNPLDGAPTGVMTTAGGKEIFLYTDTENDNIVLGREGDGNTANSSGAIVLAIYLDENPDLTGAKVWTVQYQALAHNDPASHDEVEPVDLQGKIFATASQKVEFDASAAPSGQNLFIMFGDGNVTQGDDEVGIVATGKDPLNQSNGGHITSGDTVNTSQAGGDTTFGVNNQMLTSSTMPGKGDGLYFTFVKGPNPNYTVPNLTQGDADVEANIQFNDFLDARSAEFKVVQLQGGKSAVVKITAYSETEPVANASGANFVDGLLNNNQPISIDDVQVVDADGGGEIVKTDNGNGTWTISGVEAGDIIQYSTDGDHNRVLIENAGTGRGQHSAEFDIGGFKLTEVQSATADVGFAVGFEDDGPTVTAGVVNDGSIVLTTQDAQTDGDPTGEDSASASFAAVFEAAVQPVYGADGPGTTVVSGYNLTIADANSGLGSNGLAITLAKDGADVVGSTTAGAVFRISVDAVGVVTLTQYAELDHLPEDVDATNDNTNIALAGGKVFLNATATTTDGDNDTATATISADLGGNISFDDDVPSVTAGIVNDGGIVLTTQDAQTDGDPTTEDSASASFAAVFEAAVQPVYGADGPGTTVVSGYNLTIAAEANSGLTSNGLAITLAKVGEDVVGSTTAGAVFRISVDAVGVVTLTQYAELDHLPEDVDATNDNTNIALAGGKVFLNATATTTDGDNDTATATISADLGGNISFDDDVPVIETSPVRDTAPTIGTQWVYSEAFAYAIGADTHAPTYSASDSDFTDLSLSGLANDVAIGSPSVTWDSEDGSSATFDVSFTYDHDRDPATANQPVTGTLVFDKVNDTYTLSFDALEVKQDVTLGAGTGYETYDIGGTTPSSGPSPIATGQLGEGFYIQIRGFESPLSAGGNTTVSPGELVTGDIAPVTLSSVALGVSGNTIQAGEAANLRFFTEDPKGNVNATDFAYATDFFIKFDGYETESDDLIVIVDLVDANDPSITTTRAIYVDQGDVYESDTINTDLAGTKYAPLVAALDNNDGLLIVESNDYNIQPGDNWVLRGLQILSNDAGLTGDAIDLNRNVGDDGGSSTGDTVQEDTSTNPLKIQDAGFTVVSNTPPTLDLELAFTVVDADGDTTAQQTIHAEYGLPVTLVGVADPVDSGLVL